MKTLVNALTVIAMALAASGAQAATRTYCFELLFKDDRNDCPTSADPGARRACHQDFYNWAASPDGDYTHPKGALIEVWDSDPTAPDEYIGTWFLSGSSGGCVEFEWELASYQNGEADPDPYVIWKSEVRGTGGGAHVVAVDLANVPYGGVSFRPSAYNDCFNGVACTQPGYGLVTTDSTVERGGRAMSLDSAQHMLEVYSSILEPDDIEMRWPAAASQALSQTSFEVATTRAVMAQSPTHELGHVLQMQQFDQNGLQDDCSLNGAGHSLTIPEFESCVTTEGWAGYVAAASLWDPQNNLSAPNRFTNSYTDPLPFAPVCSDNAALELQAVKAFWDLDDDENEAGLAPSGNDDGRDSDTLFIAERWGVFANGNANRQNDENDVDGVNLWDYHINNAPFWGLLDETRETLLGHNCMGTQDTN